jgi:predicted unusual protein kinase regulating ubiquinone biosynthesis (AarF/ABC1/UbiB family)
VIKISHKTIINIFILFIMVFIFLLFLFKLFINFGKIVSNYILFNMGVIKQDFYYQNIKNIIVYNGPVFIKYFQIILSKRKNNSDINYLKINGKVLNKILIDKIIELEDQVNKKIEFNRKELLDRGIVIQDKIASGSVASVYSCQHFDTESVIKLFDPYAEKNIKVGILFLKCIDFFNIYKAFNLPKIHLNFKDYQQLLISQLDTNIESKNCEKIKVMFQDYQHVIIPDIYVVQNKYIVMKKEKGKKYTNFIHQYPEKKNECIALLYGILLVMIRKKFLHADLHLGNFLFNLVDDKVQIILLDFGICLPINQEQSDILTNFINNPIDKKNIMDFICSFSNIDQCSETKRNIEKKLQKVNLDVTNKDETAIVFDILQDFHINLTIVNIFITINQLVCKINKVKKKEQKYIINYLVDNDFLE